MSFDATELARAFEAEMLETERSAPVRPAGTRSVELDLLKGASPAVRAKIRYYWSGRGLQRRGRGHARGNFRRRHELRSTPRHDRRVAARRSVFFEKDNGISELKEPFPQFFACAIKSRKQRACCDPHNAQLAHHKGTFREKGVCRVAQ